MKFPKKQKKNFENNRRKIQNRHKFQNFIRLRINFYSANVFARRIEGKRAQNMGRQQDDDNNKVNSERTVQNKPQNLLSLIMNEPSIYETEMIFYAFFSMP